jgi:GAF domain-containing protein
MPIYDLLRPATRIFYALKLKDGESVPRPRDLPAWRTAEPDSDAVLLLGNGPCHGWGVATHGLALTGQLGRALSGRTGRGGNVDYVGDESMNLASALPWIGDRELGGYDAVTVLLGVNDAIRFTPVAEWTRRLRELLTALLERLPPEARILVGGIQPPSTVPIYDSLLGRLWDRHARLLTAAVRTVAADFDRVAFFPLGPVPLDPARPFGSPDAYAAWAGAIARELAPLLDEVRVARGDAERVLPDLALAGDWAGIERAVEYAASGGSPELQRITGEARDRFGVDIATISLVDGDRLHYAVPGLLPSAVPLELTFCQYAVREAEPLIVPDARRDERFRDNPLLDIAHVQFYAGHPLQSLDGQRIGTLCLMGSRPKPASAIDRDELQRLAMQAQEELWRIERDSAPRPDQPEKTTRSR